MKSAIAAKFATIFSLLVLVATGTVGYMVYRGAEKSLINASTDGLKHTAEVIDVRLSASIEAINKDVHFLAETPPVQGIVRAIVNGQRDQETFIDPVTFIDDEEWRSQLADIFATFLQNRPSYLQASFVGEAPDNRELVRVTKRDGEIRRIAASHLRHRDASPFVQSVLDLDPGTLHLSDIVLSREYESTSSRSIPVLHAAVPVHTSSGQVFGLVMISVDMRTVLKTVRSLAEPSIDLYLVNQQGSFLVHPDSTRTLEYAPGDDYRFGDAFPQLRSWFQSHRDEARIERLEAGSDPPTIAYFEHISFGDDPTRGDLAVGLTAPYTDILTSVTQVRNRSLIITLFFCLTGILLALTFSGYLTRPLRRITRAFAEFDHDQPRDDLPLDRKDEIGVLARAFDTMSQKIRDQMHELEEKEHRQRIILETAAEGIIVVDDEGVIEAFNRAAERIFGYEACEVTGRNVNLLVGRPGTEATTLWTNVGSGREVRGVRKDGSSFSLSLAISAFELSGKQKYAAFVQDVTERKEAVEALRKSEERFARAFELGPVAAFIITSDAGTITHINESFVTLTGHDRSEALGRTVEELDLFVDLRRAHRLLQRALQGKGSYQNVELQIRTGTGAVRDILASAAVIPVDGQKRILGLLHDISDRKRLEREVLEISSREQRRIGQDLHDDLGQQLSGIRFMSESLQARLQAENSEHAASMNRIVEMHQKALSYTKNLSRMLSPVNVLAEGLMDALEQLVENAEVVFDVRCRFETESPVYIDDNKIATHLYRIAQEAVNNAAKHGKPNEIVVTLRCDDGQGVLSVRDDGSGIPEDVLQTSSGMGLHTMRYRADIIGAFLNVHPLDPHGTLVECRFTV